MIESVKTSLEEKLKIYRINSDEYKLICRLLGRPPEGVEWALFSALWSEHCSYKSSKRHLRKFYSKNKRVLESFGENAGVIDLGLGEKVAFKMESHNHPSFISPHQGAATGVGGILRDIFTMGARPIALGNYLCFGESSEKIMTHLVDGVVRGIADYGNCVGVPMVSGQTEFNSSYNGNILVNAFALGYFGSENKVFSSKAHGVGNLVVYVGAKTGKDGVHGASMASESFDSDSESKKPTVQIGDPFFEKLLIESCLEVMSLDLVEAIQDMGAAGITSSAFEMSAKGQVGLNIYLDKVPSRDFGITPEEVLLSESQERMLLMCKPDNFTKISQVFKHWDLDAEVIGEVIEEPKVHLFWHGEELTAIEPGLIVDSAPEYDRPYKPWVTKNKVDQLSGGDLTELKGALTQCLSSVFGTSRQWVYNQYDQRVGGATARDCSEAIGVVRLKESGRALGVVLGCRPYIMRTDADLGGRDAVYYPALQLASKGFEPLAITDCLNFGNPEKPELMTEFVAAVEGMSQACESIDTPVISGNVSLYNETLDKNVTSTPSTGMVGLKSELNFIPANKATKEGLNIYLLSSSNVELSGQWAELLQKPLQFKGAFNPTELSQFTKNLREFVINEKPNSTRVLGKFGFLYGASLFVSSIGGQFDLGEVFKDPSETLRENLYQVVVATEAEADFKKYNLDAQLIGVTGGNREIQMNGSCGDSWLNISLSEFNAGYDLGLPAHFKGI